MREIVNQGVLLARTGHCTEAAEGVTFYSQPKDVLQYGICNHKKTVLQPHVHMKRARVSFHRTYEFLYLISGMMECQLFNEERKYITNVILSEGDWIALHEGGHGFKVLCDNTRFLEVKNGQFLSTEQDKTRF